MNPSFFLRLARHFYNQLISVLSQPERLTMDSIQFSHFFFRIKIKLKYTPGYKFERLNFSMRCICKRDSDFKILKKLSYITLVCLMKDNLLGRRQQYSKHGRKLD